MTSQPKPSIDLGRAVALMTASSFLIPVAGLLTQPILAQSLGVEGRGELAAAVAPAALALGVATLGLPDALTFFLAKRPSVTKRAVLVSSVLTLAVGAVSVFAVILASPFLSADDPRLASYIIIAIVITMAALLVGVLRGAAAGRQMWKSIAMERVLTTTLRVGLLVALLIAGELTVLTAVLVTVAAPVLCGIVYWRLIFVPPPQFEDTDDAPMDSVSKTLVSYGARIWLGSIASVLLARTDQLLMVPLASVEDLGIFSVANTVSDIPFLVVTAIGGALIGVNSKSNNPQQIADATRLTFGGGLIGCAVLSASIPFLIVPLFGRDFEPAVVPTLILILAAVIYAPGFIASAGLSAQGRPGLRSIGLCVAFVSNLIAFVFLVPSFGVFGACWTNIITGCIFTGLALVSTSRVIGVPIRDFLAVRGEDIKTLWLQSSRIIRSSVGKK